MDNTADTDVVPVPVLHSQAGATRTHHLQTILSIKAHKVACLPLVAEEVVDVAEVDHQAADLICTNHAQQSMQCWANVLQHH
jgi:hypothetical protein